MSDLNDFYARYVSKMASYASVKFLLIKFTALVPKLDTLMLSATSYGHIVGKMNIQATPGCATCLLRTQPLRERVVSGPSIPLPYSKLPTSVHGWVIHRVAHLHNAETYISNVKILQLMAKLFSSEEL